MDEQIEETRLMIDSVEETADLREEESVSNQEVYKRGSNTYTFTCSKCGRTITINSDLYTKVEDKKAQHLCAKPAVS